ncbi:hypothetical protein BN440_1595 [Erwinia amylovora MR1]|nr:hypothetical protein BN440_1595 [Erwinia amylovora MR1]
MCHHRKEAGKTSFSARLRAGGAKKTAEKIFTGLNPAWG